MTSDDEEDAFTKEWRRAQRVLSSSGSGGITRSPAGSMRGDDVSMRDITITKLAADTDTASDAGVKTDFTIGYSPDRHHPHSVSPGSPQDDSNSPVSPTSSDAFKRHLESRLLT